jgi:hypothetical protein
MVMGWDVGRGEGSALLTFSLLLRLFLGSLLGSALVLGFRHWAVAVVFEGDFVG